MEALQVYFVTVEPAVTSCYGSTVAISIHHLDISGCVFALAARAIQRRSIELGRFASINDVVQHAAERAILIDVSGEEIEDALAIAVNGSIRISLVVRALWRPTLRAVQERFSKNIGRRLSVKQTVAILLRHPDPGSV